MKDFKRVFDLTGSKGSDLFNWLSNLKNFVLSNGSENVRNVIQMALTLYLPGYLYTIFLPGEGGKFALLSKNRLVSDRSKILCLLKLFFVKFLKTTLLRL